MAAEWDLVVAGGGPAGSAAAITARHLGLRTLVLEAARFPRDHVGESLVHLWSTFERLGVADEMDATFQHKRGSCRIWGDRPELKWTDFEVAVGGRDYSLQVDRSVFDSILLRRAEETGATVRQGCRVQEVLWESGRAVGVRYRAADGRLHEARTRWVVDATGRSGLIARRRRLRRVDPFFPDLSIYGYYREAARFGGDKSGNLLIEVVPSGWLWFIPLHTGLTSVGLVCDRSSRADLRRRGPASHFETAIKASTVVRGMLRSAVMDQGPVVTSSAGYRSTTCGGPGWLLAGDAASFVDPMWATGVATAIADGMTAAIVVEAMVDGRVDEAAGISYYAEQRELQIEMDFWLVKYVYRSNRLHADAPFWLARREAGESDELPVDRMMRRLAGDPSMRYFRRAFQGMGIADEELIRFEERFRRLDRRSELVPELMRDPDQWLPRLARSARIDPRLGIGSDHRLVEGTAISYDGLVDFTDDPLISAAFAAVNGRRSLGRIADEVSRRAPGGRRLRTRLEILASFMDAYEQGSLDFDRRSGSSTGGRI